MKVQCGAKVLADSLAIVGSVVPARTPKPVLSNVKLVAQEGSLELMATDLEVGVRRTVGGVEVEEPGEVLLPAAQALSIAREATARNVLLTTEDRVCTISYVGAKYDIPCDDPIDFPEMSTFNEKNAVTVVAEVLKSMIERTKFAVAQEPARFALNGILFSLKGDTLRLVATDGHRLAVAKGKAKNKAGIKAEPIIPTKAMDLLDKLMLNPEEKIQVEVGENQVIVQTAAGTVCSRLVEGHFPDYEDVIPKDCDKTLTISGPRLYSAIRRAALIATGESRAVRFSLRKDYLLLSTRTIEGRRSSVEAEEAKYDGEPFDIAFNPDYLMEMLKVQGDGEVSISFKENTSAAVAKGSGDYIYVVMPVQLREG